MTDTGGLVVVGANHRSASLGLRDRLFVDDSQVHQFLEHLDLPQALVLATCDRIEIWGWGGSEVAARAEAVLAERGGEGAGSFYTHRDEAALRHVFAVTSALDSLVLGEPQVPGQVKAAARLARASGRLGANLDGIVQAALAVAKRIRTETAIGEGPVSLAASACEVARDLHGDLKSLNGLLIGAGDMGELITEALVAAGLARIEVTAPRASRAEALAREFNGHVVGFADLADALPKADVVLVAVGGRNVTLTADLVGKALKKRRRRPVLLVDCGIPGDVETSVNRLDGAFLYDLADLEGVALKGRSSREQAAIAAWGILEQEVALFLRNQMALAAVPAIVSLRRHFEDVRQAALIDSGGDAERATQLLINRLLHAPSEALRDGAANGAEWAELEQALKKLFRLY